MFLFTNSDVLSRAICAKVPMNGRNCAVEDNSMMPSLI